MKSMKDFMDMEDPELEEPKQSAPVTFHYLFERADRVADEVGNEWVDEARCAGEDPELWQPKQRTLEVKAEVAEAVRKCFHECPVRLQCLKAACVGREPSGIWGGLDHSTRRADYAPTRKAHDFEALSKLPDPYRVADDQAESQ